VVTVSRVQGVVVATLLTASVAATPTAYFPLSKGASWVRRGDDGARINARVVGTKTFGPGSCTVVETVSIRLDVKRVSRICYRWSPDAVVAVETEVAGRVTIVDPPRPVMKLPPLPGKTWIWVPKIPAGEPETLTWVGEQAVRVPAGAFKAWRLRSTTKRGNVTFVIDTWYAVGVGIVKIQREISGQEGQTEGSSELVSYTIR
jgi:hypothetical protein